MKKSIEDNFFIFDSNMLDSVHSFFLGYTIYQGEEYNSNEGNIESIPSGAWEGCFIEVKKDAEHITIRQDFNGSWGIYIFEKDGYFAISNSFWILLNKIKNKYRVTLNEDYAKSMFVFDLCSLSVSETLIREIHLLPRNYVLSIDIKKKSLTPILIDFHEDEVNLDSSEGIAIVDRWFYKWTGLIRTLKAKTNNITVDLSGGMDSRIILALLLGSHIDMNEIQVHSINDKLHTHAEDFQIASEIARAFGFQLNQNKFNLSQKALTSEETIDISCNLKLGMHKEMYWKSTYNYNTLYYFTGGGGEARRTYWQMEPETFIKHQIQGGKGFSDSSFVKSTERILQHSFHDILSMNTFSKVRNDVLPERLYIETRSRQHFGKSAVGNFISNSIIESPFTDVDLRSLNLKNLNDANMLFALIWQRYCPALLKFPFEGGRSISNKTLIEAQRICQKYPFINKNENLPEVVFTGNNLEKNFSKMNGSTFSPNNVIKSYFEKSDFKDFFTSRFSQEIYDSAKKYSESASYFPLRQIYQAVATEKALRVIDVSQNLGIFTDIISHNNRKVNSATLTYRRNRLNWINNILHRARIDIKNIGEGNDLKIIINSPIQHHDTPAWYSKNGIGHVLESESKDLTMNIFCKGKGTFELLLRGIDYRYKGERIPIFIDYFTCKINGKEYFKNPCSVSHDEPCHIYIPCTDGQKFVIELKWDRHGYSDQEYKDLVDMLLD